MNNGLINLMTSESLQGQAVSAQDLYKFLEIKTPFKDWIKRMFDYGFEVNKDYIIMLKNAQNPISKSNPLNYAITLAMAKEISMIQRSEKGKQARSYFIACEEQLKEIVKPKTRVELARINLELEIEAEEREALLQITTPKALKYDSFMNSDTLQSATQVASVLGISAVALNKVLEKFDVYDKRIKRTRVFQKWFTERNLGKTIESERGYTQSLFTPLGVDYAIECHSLEPKKLK